MTDPTKPQADKNKFAPQNVAQADDGKDHRKDLKGRDLPRGSETDTRGASGNRI